MIPWIALVLAIAGLVVDGLVIAHLFSRKEGRNARSYAEPESDAAMLLRYRRAIHDSVLRPGWYPDSTGDAAAFGRSEFIDTLTFAHKNGYGETDVCAIVEANLDAAREALEHSIAKTLFDTDESRAGVQFCAVCRGEHFAAKHPAELEHLRPWVRWRDLRDDG